MDKKSVNKIKITLSKDAIIRCNGLLYMEYKIQEIIDELKVSEGTIQDWIKSGAPFRYDADGTIWIVGTTLANWIEQTRILQKKDKQMGVHEGFCFKCNKAIEMKNVSINSVGITILKQGTCPDCGSKVNRGLSAKEVEE